MEKRTVVKRIEIGTDGGVAHVVVAKQIVEPCTITKLDENGVEVTEAGERLMLDEPHRIALYPSEPIAEQIVAASAAIEKLGYPPIPPSGIDQIKRLIAAL